MSICVINAVSYVSFVLSTEYHLGLRVACWQQQQHRQQRPVRSQSADQTNASEIARVP